MASAESEPLKKGAAADEEGYDTFARRRSLHPSALQDLEECGIANSMVYRANILGSWETFSVMLRKTVWNSNKLWGMMLKLFILSLSVSVIPILVVPDPAALKVKRLTAVSQFLNVVVGLLLGFFLTSSVNRWYACVDGFLSLLDAIRNLQMQLIALGVPHENGGPILRYAFASAYLLYEQLLLEPKKLSSKFSMAEESASMWKKVSKKAANMIQEPDVMILEEAAIELLKETRDPPSVLWTWNGAMIGRLAQDGWIPPMATPTYGRIMNLCQTAHGGIRAVRASICVQTPWNYAQCLASLVHINNALNAIILGLVAGVVMATCVQRNSAGLGWYHRSKVSSEEMDRDIEEFFVTCLLCTLGPLLYQALLLIGISLAQPFEDDDARIPLDRLLNQLETDMSDSMDLIDAMEEELDFEPPAFKQNPKKSEKQGP
eukprot:gb/GFBE01037511.1/.p1 GENE.gb/GFBE01037511.1/~~gb/GFBE01037511.1/.p1  ORF type:complete len:433 (+),score=93.35 gb/GFBE01037511.1/:1-1299(+)